MIMDIGIFIDLQKAFDTVDHKILLRKLDYYGIRGIDNDWIKSYLTNRKQFVSTNGFSDDWNTCHVTSICERVDHPISPQY